MGNLVTYEKKFYHMSVSEITELFSSGKWTIDPLIQRGPCWTKLEEQKFFLSLVTSYSTGLIIVEKRRKVEVQLITDGQQRCIAIQRIITNQVALPSNCPTLDGENIAGLFFKDLSKKLQNRVLNAVLNVEIFEPMPQLNREYGFTLPNSGKALVSQEVTRVEAGAKVMDTVRRLAANTMFASRINWIGSNTKRFAHEYTVIQILRLLSKNEACSLSSKDCKIWIKQFYDTGLPINLVEKFTIILAYLNEAILQWEFHLRRNTFIVLFVIAEKAIKQNIRPDEFYDWMSDFFRRNLEKKCGDTPYKIASSNASASSTQVRIRIELMEEDYNDYTSTPYTKRRR